MQDGQTILARLTAITTTLASVRNLEALAKAIHEVVEDTIAVEYSGVYMRDFTTNALRLWHTKGFSPQEHEEAERTAWDRHPGWVVRNKEMLHVRDTNSDSRSKDSKRGAQIRSRLWVPIIVENEAIGAMGMASTTVDAFSAADITILQYASTTSGFMYKNPNDSWSLEQQLILAEKQRKELVALSSPRVEVWNHIIVMPIIGQVDEARAQQMTEKVLDTITTRKIHTVILDMTGVASVDPGSIHHLERLQQAIQLLGSACVFTGISSTTATVMAKMGLELEKWTTFASIRQALGRLSTHTPKATLSSNYKRPNS